MLKETNRIEEDIKTKNAIQKELFKREGIKHLNAIQDETGKLDLTKLKQFSKMKNKVWGPLAKIAIEQDK